MTDEDAAEPATPDWLPFGPSSRDAEAPSPEALAAAEADPTALLFGGDDDFEEPVEAAALPLEPAPPATRPAPAWVILGRFQPFHLGHAALFRAAFEGAASCASPPEVLRVAIGSSNRPTSLTNPWTWQERVRLIEAWWSSDGEAAARDAGLPDLGLECVAIPDLGDPPNWVAHAEQYHGDAGTLATSDEATADLYRAAGWPVVALDLHERDRLEGWRVRETLRMLSTIPELEAIRPIAAASLPEAVIESLVADDGLWRLSQLMPELERA